jgi:hypothetical protein
MYAVEPELQCEVIKKEYKGKDCQREKHSCFRKYTLKKDRKAPFETNTKHIMMHV